MNNWKIITPRRLAVRFGKLLRQNMTDKEYRLAIHRNRTEKDNLVCHSHDFCDANMVMHDALTSLGVDRRGLSRLLCIPGPMNQLFLDAWNLWYKDPWIGVSWRKHEENKFRTMRWKHAYEHALRLMEVHDDLEPRSALKVSADDACIPQSDWPAYVEWAESQLTTQA
jgi:hypothetical protein